ncbi:unnamed protein product [Auanema sp. JU1783]|nr:unnamed protein product [Auanema sp. JU1783]
MTIDEKNEIFGVQSCCCKNEETNQNSAQVVTLAKDTNYTKRLRFNSAQFEVLSPKNRYLNNRSKWCTDTKCLSHSGALANFLRQWYRLRNNVCAHCATLCYAEDAKFTFTNHIITEEFCRRCLTRAQTTWDVGATLNKKHDSAMVLAIKTQGVDALCPSPSICKKTLTSPVHMCTCSNNSYLIVNLENAKDLRVFRNIKEA